MYIRLARVSNDNLGFLYSETVSYRVEGTRIVFLKKFVSLIKNINFRVKKDNN